MKLQSLLLVFTLGQARTDEMRRQIKLRNAERIADKAVNLYEHAMNKAEELTDRSQVFRFFFLFSLNLTNN